MFGWSKSSPHTYSTASGSVESVPFWLSRIQAMNSSRRSGLTQSFTLRQNLLPGSIPLVTALARLIGVPARPASAVRLNVADDAKKPAADSERAASESI